MKTLIAFIIGATILIGANSCLVVQEPQHDNGKHRGWYKNPHNPHNPQHTTNTTVIIHEDEKGKGKHGH
jgi:hypothetical protein